MATEPKPADRPAIGLAPPAYRGERWWPVALAIIAVASLHVILPARYRVQPAWVVPAVLLGLLAVLIAGDPGRIDRQNKWLRIVTSLVIAFITLANLFAAVRLVVDILTNDTLYRSNPGGLLAVGGVIWVTNVIAFGLWYWGFDRGGPIRRLQPDPPPPDFQFPQMENPQLAAPGWHPHIVDYIYVSFTNAIAFSPTDAMPLSRRAKLMMLAESGISALTVLLVTARAVNIFT